jgi:predicted NBD/HSP70 family sugar kinase
MKAADQQRNLILITLGTGIGKGGGVGGTPRTTSTSCCVTTASSS